MTPSVRDIPRRLLSPRRYWWLVELRDRTLEVAARIISVALRLLPASLTVAVRERIGLVRPLDLPDERLVIRVTNPTELRMRTRPCRKEPETVAWLRRTLDRSAVLYDVGANVGAYSLVAAALGAARVYAFEPVPATFAHLVDNIALNRFESRIVPIQLALADRTAPVHFEVSTTMAGGASHRGLRTDEAGPVRTGTLLGYRLDDAVGHLGLATPSHLKIDVDGSETQVLGGAERTLRTPSLRYVLIEVDENESDVEAVRAALASAGFVVVEDNQHPDSRTHNWILERRPS